MQLWKNRFGSFFLQIFEKEGRFKFQFGECGKRDGQLLYPNRVAVIKNSGDIIVTERSPTHQVFRIILVNHEPLGLRRFYLIFDDIPRCKSIISMASLFESLEQISFNTPGVFAWTTEEGLLLLNAKL